jgi:hypothetical protein
LLVAGTPRFPELLEKASKKPQQFHAIATKILGQVQLTDLIQKGKIGWYRSLHIFGTGALPRPFYCRSVSTLGAQNGYA